MRKAKINTGVMWSEGHIKLLDDFCDHLRDNTDFVDISRSSISEMIVDLGLKMLPYFSASSDLHEDFFHDLSEEEYCLYKEICAFDDAA